MRARRISPPSGTRRDFRKPQTYTVTAADGTKRTWTVEAVPIAQPGPARPQRRPRHPVSATAATGSTRRPTASRGWSGTRFKAYSSKDLVHWKDHGVDPRPRPRRVLGGQVRLGARRSPSANGKYYFYFCAEQQIGVAVADSPTGPFKDALGKPLVAKGAAAGPDDRPGGLHRRRRPVVPLLGQRPRRTSSR